jgi:N6-adenosine-specific RNA methylase IME4
MKYRTIVADPPWDYTGTTFRQGAGHGAKYKNRPLPYGSMTTAEIAALPVSEISEDDATLFLWTTSRYLPKSFAVVEAWGFRYVQMLVWVKPGPTPMCFPFAPPATEFLLGCKRGRPARMGGFPSSAIIAPQEEHSRKPELFLDYIEQVSPGPYLELFARRNRLGWDTWGNECLEHVAVAQ